MPTTHHAQLTAMFTLLDRAERDRRQRRAAQLGLPARRRRGRGRAARRPGAAVPSDVRTH